LLLALAIELALLCSARAFRLGAGAILLVLAALTVARNQVYASEIALWEDTVRKSPNKARVHNNLGYAYHLAGRNQDALREYKAALRFDPQYIKARCNLERLETKMQP
jgi:Flp pilus assembly protein TadD